MTNQRFFLAITGVFATALVACSPGYMKASELESKHQGPSDCEARCVELGMRMGALVLVSDTLPGCVCQPVPAAPGAAPAPPAPPALPPQPAPPAASAPPGAPNPAPPASAPVPVSDASQQGASAATASYVVATMAAAAAARSNQVDQQRRAQQSYLPK